MAVTVKVMIVKSMIGRGSFDCAKIGDAAAKERAKKLQKPSAVAAYPTGNNIGCAT